MFNFNTGIDGLILAALKEDIGSGDVTTQATVEPAKRAKAHIIAKQDLVLAGNPVASRVFHLLDPELEYRALAEDGARMEPGQIAATLAGSAASLLTGERTALNFLQHLSGIATYTDKFVKATSGTKATIVDTRKTTPGLRVLEKYAVRMGGGSNHRMSLSDGVLIKDNHIAQCGGIARAVGLARSRVGHFLKIEVEVKNAAEAREALEAGADIIMLDNMSHEDIKKAVTEIGGRALVEASGGIDLNSVTQIAAQGVDLISVGALTHSAPAADLSMNFID
jgi:nicotinate-nucleotide pyrophosphorylase (carboxylating)